MSTKVIPAKLILGGSPKERLDQAFLLVEKFLGQVDKAKGHPDLIVLEAGLSLGISSVRKLQRQLAFQPYAGPLKIALFPQAEKLTIAAQNALLKTLEEPPTKSLLILLATQKEALLPTIVSRCQIISLVQKSQIELEKNSASQHLDLLASISTAGAGQRLKLAAQFRSRQEALILAEQLLFLWRQLLLVKVGAIKKSFPKPLKEFDLNQIKRALENTQLARQMLVANVNPLLTIESLFLSFPK